MSVTTAPGGWGNGVAIALRTVVVVVAILIVVQSLIVDPGRPARAGTRLRSFLEDWIAPSVRAHAALPH